MRLINDFAGHTFGRLKVQSKIGPKWALANGYAAHLTIDREKNDRGYEPSNCHWDHTSRPATQQEDT